MRGTNVLGACHEQGRCEGSWGTTFSAGCAGAVESMGWVKNTSKPGAVKGFSLILHLHAAFYASGYGFEIAQVVIKVQGDGGLPWFVAFPI